MYKKILLAVDGSNHSLRATKEVIKITSCMTDYKVYVVYVADFSKVKAEVLHSHGKEEIEVTRRKKLFPIENELNMQKINYEFTLLRGEPGPTIVDYANKNDFDLVVIGSRGLNSLQEMVLGGVSHKVMKRVKCPALIVK
ncbi:universal stress protein [Bacillus sp. CGMCC 1.16541]|uniref:universal stress protein n=1 Tax=Bacillus sp. CGMCC 1.16541 TaxID=2185143 RepID=UPI000D725C96|nr:universal stress protein [Bacillus sp. CGMCC 1.16541]